MQEQVINNDQKKQYVPTEPSPYIEKDRKRNKKLYKNRDTVKLIRGLNSVTMFVDLIVVIIYFILLALFFGSLKVPPSTAAIARPHAAVDYSVNVMGKYFFYETVNSLITWFVIFFIIGISLLVYNFNHHRKMEIYDYHRWEAGNMLVHVLGSILTLNVISALMRIAISNLIFRYSEGVGFVGMLHILRYERREKRNKKKFYDDHEISEEEMEIKRKVRKQTAWKVFRYFFIYLFLILVAIFVLIPFYWMILTALKTYDQAKATNPAFFIPFKDLQWVNLKFVVANLNFGIYIRNTLIVAIFSTLGTIITTILAAYAFSKIDFKGRELIFSILLMTMMIPGEIYMITNYITVGRSGFNWIGEGATALTYFLSMILPFMTSIFYIYFLRQTFKQVPDALYKAAKVDGCSDFKFLTRVMIPIAGPTIFTITILSILGTWNAYIWPQLITAAAPTTGQRYWLISVALRRHSFVLDDGSGGGLPMYNLQIAASAIVTIPLLVVFLTLRKYIITGVGRSGTKG